MHSFHHSRGRILFEVFCALAVSASCVGAWMQTGASALLGAAAVAALYGLWHLTDLGARKPQPATGRVEEEVVVEERPAPSKFEQLTAPVEVLGLAEAVEVAEPPPPAEIAELEPAPRPKSQAKRPKARRKSSPREEARVVELAPAEEPAIEIVSAPEEDAHGHLTPLFETDPFARMPRRAFGRKAG